MPAVQERVSARQSAYIGLGANIGDPVSCLRSAVAALAKLPETKLEAVSSLYQTAPIDATGPDFFNAVAHVQTRLTPLGLLDAVQRIENQHGRLRPFPNAPRTLDLDLLLYADLVCQTQRLILPHPRMSQRAFVLQPLMEMAPNLRIPGAGALSDLLLKLGDQRIVRCGALMP